MAIRRATFKLYPSKQIKQTMFYHRRLHKDLYNAAVCNRYTQYQKFHHSVDYLEQQNCLPEFKQVWTEYLEINSQALQATLKRVDYAFCRWFKRLGKRPRYKSIRHYSGWTYPATSGWSVETNGENGYLNLAKVGRIQMRGQAKFWGQPTTCTIVYRHGCWYASITVDVLDRLLKAEVLPTGAVGIDFGCVHALAITDGENHQTIAAPKFLRKAEHKLKKASKKKRRKQSPNWKKRQKASRRWKKAQKQVSKLSKHIANCRQNWVHHVAKETCRCNSLIATEELELQKMTRKSKKGKRKKQKAGLNKSILDVGMGMLRQNIKYKIEQMGGVFTLVPTKTVKPSQRCPKCGNLEKKERDQRIHDCKKCGYVQDRDIAAGEVMLLWAKGILPGEGTCLVDGDVSSSTKKTRKQAGSMRQLGQLKRKKSQSAVGDVETPTLQNRLG